MLTAVKAIVEFTTLGSVYPFIVMHNHCSLRKSVYLDQIWLCKSCIFPKRTCKWLPLLGSRLTSILLLAKSWIEDTWNITTELQRARSTGFGLHPVEPIASILACWPAFCMHVSPSGGVPILSLENHSLAAQLQLQRQLLFQGLVPSARSNLVLLSEGHVCYTLQDGPSSVHSKRPTHPHALLWGATALVTLGKALIPLWASICPLGKLEW